VNIEEIEKVLNPEQSDGIAKMTLNLARASGLFGNGYRLSCNTCNEVGTFVWREDYVYIRCTACDSRYHRDLDLINIIRK
jgi:hypothetical protein